MALVVDDEEGFTVTTEAAATAAKGLIATYTRPATVEPGATITVSATIKNTGEQTGNFFLHITRNSDGSQMVNLPNFNLGGGGSVAKTLSFAAPTTEGSVAYTLRLKRNTG